MSWEWRLKTKMVSTLVVMYFILSLPPLLSLSPSLNVFCFFSETFNFQLNGDIAYDEVTEAIIHLKQSKAGGQNTLIPEVFIHSAEAIKLFICYRTFHSSFFFFFFKVSSQKTEATIQPVHKKGIAQDPNNDWGMSLLNMCSKLYSYILN